MLGKKLWGLFTKHSIVQKGGSSDECSTFPIYLFSIAFHAPNILIAVTYPYVSSCCPVFAYLTISDISKIKPHKWETLVQRNPVHVWFHKFICNSSNCGMAFLFLWCGISALGQEELCSVLGTERPLMPSIFSSWWHFWMLTEKAVNQMDF